MSLQAPFLTLGILGAYEPDVLAFLLDRADEKVGGQMGWFKVDDNLAFHQKTLAAGNAAMGLWVRAGSWSRSTGSDGFISDLIARQLGTKAQADTLVAVGFWDRLPTGYAFHEWDERQPSAADEKAAAEAAGRSGSLGNHKRWHLAKKVRNPDCAYCLKEAK